MTSVTICNVEYQLTDEPTHGLVRKLRKERKNYIINIFKNIEGLDLKEDVDKQINDLMKKDPEFAMQFAEDEEDFKIRSTISLATNHLFTDEELENIPIRNIYKKCCDALGGDADDFFGTYLTR